MNILRKYREFLKFNQVHDETANAYLRVLKRIAYIHNDVETLNSSQIADVYEAQLRLNTTQIYQQSLKARLKRFYVDFLKYHPGIIEKTVEVIEYKDFKSIIKQTSNKRYLLCILLVYVGMQNKDITRLKTSDLILRKRWYCYS